MRCWNPARPPAGPRPQSIPDRGENKTPAADGRKNQTQPHPYLEQRHTHAPRAEVAPVACPLAGGASALTPPTTPMPHDEEYRPGESAAASEPKKVPMASEPQQYRDDSRQQPRSN